MLRAAADPTNGPSLMRLLAGNRWRIGPRDIAGAVGAGARAGPRLAGLRTGRGREAEASLADALADPGPAEQFSTLGYLRFAQLHEELSWIRSRLGQSLPDVVGDVIAHTGLDVEVMLHHGDLSNLDEFMDIAASYENDTSGASIPGFLSYLESAAERERGLVVEGANPAGGVVQLMTVHAAKGLEWDVVAVPGLCEGILPTSVKRDSTWVSDAARLPYGLRGDAENLPVLYLDDATVPVGGEKGGGGVQARRRGGAAGGGAPPGVRGVDPREAGAAGERVLVGRRAGASRKPAPYLNEARAAGPEHRCGPTRVRRTRSRTRRAPPSGRARRPWVRGRRRSRRRRTWCWARPGPAEEGPLARAWQEEAELLLAERDERESGVVRLPRPSRLSTSQLMAMRSDEEGFAAERRRPMPVPPRPATQRGTEFHAWVEEFFGGGTLFDPADLPGASDTVGPDADLNRLKDAFRNSQWAKRRIAAQEVPFVIAYEGTIVRGRIDAVFHGANGGYDIVDWKTGRPPTGEAAEHAALQLKVYRKAWARLKNIDEAEVRTAFHYMAPTRPGGPTWISAPALRRSRQRCRRFAVRR